MNKYILLLALGTTVLSGCKEFKKSDMENPFLKPYTTPYEVPPFNEIRNEHFKPAFVKGIQEQSAEVDAIASNPELPTFENTIEALEYSGALLKKVSLVFFNYLSANTSPELQAIAEEVTPALTKHEDNIKLNGKLFKRIQSVYNQRASLQLDPEQKVLLEETYKKFIRGGAALAASEQTRFREINERIALLTLKFGDNVLAENNDYMLVVDKEEDLAGLPESLKNAAAEEAKAKGKKGKWVFTLQYPSIFPFLQYADNRTLREQIFKAYLERGNKGNDVDNKAIITELTALRAERATMLGYENHAAYVLDESMAKTPEQVNNLLEKLWKAALPVAQREQQELQALADKEGGHFQLAAWDWSYYAEKLKKERFAYDEEAFRPYFSLDKVTEGVFLVCKKLYGLEFVKRTDLPTYHPDAIPYEVKEADGKFVGILYMDFFPRASKQGGAWMTNYREQSISRDGQFVHPVISIVCNFSKPVGDEPALLNFDEVITYFHEFGHALHGLLSKCHYESLAGTNVSRDFVELPSQVLENWSTEPEVLKLFARHYKTGEVIPDELIEKYKNASKFNQGFATVEYLAASILDMKYHMLSNGQKVDNVTAFEKNAMDEIGLMSAIPPRYRSTYFNHVFSGGYSAGYYSYIWSQMLDADAFEYFKQKGLFDPATATAFRKNVLERGATEEPMKLYKQFRGQEPTIDALLKRKGLNNPEIVQPKR